VRRIFCLVAGLLLAITGCGSLQRPVITIASLSPLRAGSATDGQAISDGARLAVEEQQQTLLQVGYQLRFTELDDQGDPGVGPGVAVAAAKGDRSLLAIVGTLDSGVGIPTSEALLPYGLTMVSPANTAVAVTDRTLPDGSPYPNINRIVARDDLQGLAAARFLRYGLGKSTLFVVDDNSGYGRGVADQVVAEAGRLGLTVVGRACVQAPVQGPDDPGESTLSPRPGGLKCDTLRRAVTRMGQQPPQAVYFGGLAAEAAILIKLMRGAGMTAPLVSDDGLDTTDWYTAAGAAGDGAYYTTVAGPVQGTAAGRQWAARFQQRFGHAPESFAAYGYDAAMVVLEALRDYGRRNPGRTPTRAELAQLVRQTAGMQGVATQVSFDQKGDNKDARVFLYHYDFSKQHYPGVLLGEG